MNSTSTFLPTADTDLLRIQHRLIAVWALAEGVLGGVLHALHLPVTGLLIGSIAIVCLSLLAQFRRRRGDLIKATIIVLLIKAMLSPQAPLAAYVAVLSQGLLAEFFFFSKRYFRTACILFGLTTQLQSALLHIGKMVIVFGLDFWKATDDYFGKILQSLGLQHNSFALYAAIIYVAFHLLAGVLAGLFSANLPRRIANLPVVKTAKTGKDFECTLPEKPASKPKKFSVQFSIVLIWVMLLIVFLQSYFDIGPAFLPQHKLFQILIRSLLIVGIWYYVASPLLLKIMKKWLSGKKFALQTELETVLNLLPETGWLVKISWHQSGKTAAKGWRRISIFTNLLLRYLFTVPDRS